MNPIGRALAGARRAIGRLFTGGKALSSPALNRGGWLPVILESFAGAWQKNVTIDRNTVVTQSAVFSCSTLISSDIAKLRPRLMRRDRDGIWEEVDRAPFSDVLRKPNASQTRIQFWESWILSKLTRGNTYALKGRDARGNVISLYVLDPDRVKTLIADNGDIFYELHQDNFSGLEGQITVPAREIIHDLMNPIFHPLVGTSPIVAAGLAATQAINIQNDATNFFGNQSLPGGLLLAPGAISDDTAKRLKEDWETKFSGKNFGKIAVLGDGLKFEAMRAKSTDSQLIEQLKWTAETVCSVFHVPPYKIGIGATPAYNNIQALNTEYYSQALQILIEAAELALDEGLGLPRGTGVNFDLDGLLRMDTATQTESVEKAIGAGFMSPNEGRKKFNMKPVVGGESPYLQQQNFSLAALAARDSQNPLGTPANDQAASRAALRASVRRRLRLAS